MATTPLPVRYLRAFDAETGLAGRIAFVVLADQAEPAGVEDDDVALADLDVLLLGDFVDLLDVEGGAFLHDVGVEIGGHVEQHAARDDRRHLLDTELLQAVRIGEIGELVAVVIDVLDAEMAEAVDLAADADPRVKDVVVIGRLVRTETRAAGLSGLNDGELERAWRIGGCLWRDGNAEGVGLAGLHQRGGLHHQLRRHVIGGTDLVVRSPFRFGPVLCACSS